MADATPITQLKGVGEKTAKLFQKLHIETVEQLLVHFPREYDTFQPPVAIAEAAVGSICSICGRISGTVSIKKVRNLTIINVIVKDSSGAMTLTFFNQPYLKNIFRNGSVYVFRGMLQGKGNVKVLEQPKYYSVEEYNTLLKCIQPRYALTKGLNNHAVSKAMQQALALMQCDEPYPQRFLQEHHLMKRSEAMRQIHFPVSFEELIRARRRLVFDEFFSFLYFLRENKTAAEQLANEYPMLETADTRCFLEQLPYELTRAQKKVWVEIQNDLNSPYSMNRLVQGDVGSGKTIVAVLALLMCAANGYQGALMAPTEVLAQQHYEGVMEYVEKYHIALRPVLLVGSMTAAQKKAAYARLLSGEANLVIGTHAIIQEKVSFQKLALVVTDEQHRFGVRQRETLAEKGRNPHVLVMSATPIPRTLAIIMYGDLQLSVIDELPANRLPIKNCVVNTSFRPKAYEFIAREAEKGRQAYVICPMVEEGDMEGLENVVDYTEKLRSHLPASLRLAYLHGKMKPAEKNRIMEEFSQQKIDVLVSTTVIEVGINVPNATVMMVENAERFGLAQLHQLRGRVGRGEHQSYCIFISTRDNTETMKRLEILNKSNDGFFIASEDMKLRGPGDLFGIRQSGDFAFRMGDIYNDTDILKEVAEAVGGLSTGYYTEEEEEMIIKAMTCSNEYKVDFRTI